MHVHHDVAFLNWACYASELQRLLEQVNQALAIKRAGDSGQQ